MLRFPEERREARRRVKPGQAQPVERPVPPDDPGGLHIADQCVVLDLQNASSRRQRLQIVAS
jgi:hypothetical protein